MIFFESTFNKLFKKKFPFQLPNWFSCIIADWAWLIIIGVVIVQPPINLGYWSAMSTDRVGPNVLSYIALLITACAMVLQIVAIPLLKSLKRSGWILLYMSAFMTLLYGVVRLFSAEQSIGPLFGMTFLTVLFLYTLFQIRQYFKA